MANSKTTQKRTAVIDRAAPSTFCIVAIGASSGGLEAATELFRNLPADTGMAFIYVQHLSPDHKSMLTEILSKTTRMKVQEIDDMDKIKPDNVFVIPYNKGIEVTDGHIKLIPRSASSAAVSIDVLFTSLAQSQKRRVIGVILSGSASDGSLGIRAVKQEGGLTFAQDGTAKFSSMPKSAIATGAVDFILPPNEIAFELGRISKFPFSKNNYIKKGEEDSIDNNDADLKLILSSLYKSTGVDFSVYKMNTIKRRILRRMLLRKIETISEYAKLFSLQNEEVGILYQDLLINVTSFFRDSTTHKYLRTTLLPKIFKSKEKDEPVRIWIPACSTGEEAYSIAIMILEITEGKSFKNPIQIFATDLSPKAISKARAGVYFEDELKAVSPKRIKRFFTSVEGGFRINKTVRAMCVFAPHNILSDPPFLRLDFISCCNLFIYFDISAQKRATGIFHYALNENGFLMLGVSESISTSTKHFTLVNKKFKIYSRNKNSGKGIPPLAPRRVPYGDFVQEDAEEKANKIATPLKRKLPVSNAGIHDRIDAFLVSEFMPPSIVINYQMEILEFRGSTDLYFTHPSGKASFNVFKMVRPEIAFELRNTISKAIKAKKRVRKSGIEMKANDVVRIVSIEVSPVKIEWEEPLMLIVFTEHEQVELLGKGTRDRKNYSVAKDRRIKKLENELANSHSDALLFSQEHEEFTQELQSANEEVVSSNEELQTLNEELETSKEEIESVNEELINTNQELQTRNDLLNESYEYSEAIVSTIHEPMIVLDRTLRVKSANKAFYEKFSLKEESTEGLLLYDLGEKQWNIPKLRELLEDIIPKNSQFHGYEVTHRFINIGKKIMLLNARRLVQKAQSEQLILLAIHDVTELRRLVGEKESVEKKLNSKESRDRRIERKVLEVAVENRTRELANANRSLEEKNVELQNLNTELESFTYISSHDMQEPLRKIQTFAGRLLAKEKFSASGKGYFQVIIDSAKRMQALIQDLLAFSRISAEERKFENVDFGAVVGLVKEDLKETIEMKNAIIDVEANCKVNVILFQFRQLLYNLISNSLKFSRSDLAPHIMIKCSKMKYTGTGITTLISGKTYFHISVSDNGIGFESQFNTRVFEVFQRLHSKTQYAGTGIGLAIVKKIIENHNGIISATGETNKGVMFDIYLPVRKLK